MSSLVLDSLEIENFRTFRHLKIERLGRVNLIVGKNNVGKTSLLEALKVYASGGTPETIWNILASRQESLPFSTRNEVPLSEKLSALNHLLYGYPEIKPGMETSTIKIGSPSSPSKLLLLSIQWYFRDRAGYRKPRHEAKDIIEFSSALPMFISSTPQGGETAYHLDDENSTIFSYAYAPIRHIYLPANTSSINHSELWDQAVLAGREKEIIEMLKIITPNLDKLHIVRPTGREPRVMAKIVSLDRFVPLASLGAGMTRLFEVALALANTHDGLLLTDEIENGFHYSVLPKLWRFIFEQADRLNVQVFATTHSWECIQAFQGAATENESVEGMLFSLREKQGRAGEIAAVHLDERDMEIATHANIEVR